MPILANSLLSSSVANDTFMDRTVDTDTTGVVSLLNTDAASGDTISNAQQAINENSIKQNATVSLLASDSLAIDDVHKLQYFRVAGNGTAVTLTTPFDNEPKDGSRIFIVGTDNSLTVTLSFSDTTNGLLINGDAILFRGAMIQLIYDAVLERYIEIGRNF